MKITVSKELIGNPSAVIVPIFKDDKLDSNLKSVARKYSINFDLISEDFKASEKEIISTYSKKTPNIKVLDSDRRHLAIKWAWESEKFIYNPEFQHLMDSILYNE